MKKLTYTAFLSALLTMPVLAFAATSQLTRTGGLIRRVGDLIDISIGIVAAMALLAFFWGLTQYIYKKASDPKAAGEGKTLMIWGTIALFVMVSVWGLVRFLQVEFDINDTSNVSIPGYTNSIR